MSLLVTVGPLHPSLRPRRGQAPRWVRAEVERLSRTDATDGYSVLVPSPWSLLPLGEWASALALGEELPQQLSLDEILKGCRSRRVDDLETSSLWHLLTGGSLGVYLPVEVEAGQESEDGRIFGSSQRLRDECAQVATEAGLRPPFHQELEQRRSRLAKRGHVYDSWAGLDLEVCSLLALHEAACRSVERSLAVNLLPVIDAKPLGETIYDSVRDFQGFLDITAARATRAGLAMRVVFPSGYAYEIPLEYLLTWFSEFEALRPGRADRLMITRVGRLRGAVSTLHLTLAGQHTPPTTIYLSGRSVLTWCEPDFDCFAWPIGEPGPRANRPTQAEAEALRVRTGPPRPPAPKPPAPSRPNPT